MPDLREKVLALADSVDDMTTNRNFALAVAALVAEECARECDELSEEWGIRGFRIAESIRRLAEALK